MKLNFITAAVMAATLLVAATGCQKQSESEIHDTVVIQTKLTSGTPATKVTGGEDNITIAATCDWSLEGEDWFTIEPASGAQGISESIITTQPNNTGEDRKGTIKLKAGSYTSTYTFTQAGR